MIRHSARLVAVAGVAGLLFYFSSMGSGIRARYAEENAGWRRAVYREKAINYVNSRYWDPILGTGYERLVARSDEFTMPDHDVLDPNTQAWRSARDIAQGSPIHCAPLTMYGEYGWAGMAMLAGLLLSVLISIAGVFPLARRVGRPVDTQFFIALFAR